LIDNSKPSKNDILRQIGSADPRSPVYGGDELSIKSYFANRNKASRHRLTVRQESNR
jgi:hypothetical protein